MNAGCVGNIAHNLARVFIHNNHMRRTRNVHTPRGTVDREVIPATFATEFVSVDEVIAGVSGDRSDREDEEEKIRASNTTRHNRPRSGIVQRYVTPGIVKPALRRSDSTAYIGFTSKPRSAAASRNLWSTANGASI